MNRTLLALIIVCLGSLFSHSAFASTLETFNSYYVDLHFGRTADFKEVKSVMAHTGVLVVPPSFFGRSPYWADVKDVPLQASVDGFVARTWLHTEGSTGSVSYQLTPVVQYFIDFVDGSRAITEVFPLPINNIIYVYYPNDFVEFAKSQIAANKTPTSSRVVFGAFDHSSWERINRLEEESGVLNFFR